MRRRRLATLAPFTLLLVALAGSCERAPSPEGASTPRGTDDAIDLLLITVDTLRPDALGWVAGGDWTPSLDRLAAEGFRFPAAVAPVPLTLPSHTSLMTALVPPRHGVRDNGQLVGPALPTLGEALTAAGYATAAFVSGFPLAAQFGLDRGFAHYDDRLTAGEGAWLERRAAETTRAAAGWLSAAIESGEPWALWVHYYDPHYPYEPPADLLLPGERGAYLGEVAAVDRAVGDLLRVATASRRPRLTVFTADHGESLGEHGEGTHGFFVYDATMLVPLVFHLPDRLAPGESGVAARLVDVAPTVLDLLGLPALTAEGGVDGISLLPLLAGEAGGPPAAYLETWQPWTSYGWAPLTAVRGQRFKWISAPRPELYDLVRDPGERHNLFEPGALAAGGESERAMAAARRLRAVLREVEERPVVAAEAVADPETVARLAALGYIGTGSSPGAPPPGLPDPKERIALREALTDADGLMRAGDVAAALARFESVLAAEPGNRFALVRSGIALERLGRVDEGIVRLRRAVAAAGADAESRTALAEALLRADRSAEAADEWAEVVRLQPRRAAAWSSLGTALGRAGRAADAVAALERALELEPHSPERLIRLAFAEHAAGRKAAAASHLEAAAGLADESFAHAGALGLILSDLGRPLEARRWLAASRRGEPEFAAARFRLAEIAVAAGDLVVAGQALGEAVAADSRLARRAAADPGLAPLLDASRRR